MVGQSANAGIPRDTAPSWVALVVGQGSAAHPHVRSLSSFDGAATTRNAADALHHLSMLHGRHPGVIDHATLRTASDDARPGMFALADAFATETELLGKLVVAAGPIPSTPGQAETEASVLAQRHAIDMLAQSDRQGCAVGAALAVALDWHAIRRTLDAAGRRFGIETGTTGLADPDELIEISRLACTNPATERALLFGAQQIATQHHGLWDLLEARAKARLHC